MKNRNNIYLGIVLLSGILFFIPNLGKVHLFDWDEINFAESAREMIVTGDYSRVMINFQPFWEKPPLFFWLQALSMHVFGINEFAARFPNALIGIVSLVSIYLIGKKRIDAKFGFIWSLSYLGSFLPHLYFKSGIIDPVFNYFIFMGLYFIFEVFEKEGKSGYKALLSGTFIGLANLTKGPVGLLVFLLTIGIYWAFMRFRKLTSFRNGVIFCFSFLVVSFFWFGGEVMKHGFWFLNEFIHYQVNLLTSPVAGHSGPLYYHFVIILLGCFPISIFAMPTLFTAKFDEGKLFNRLMRVLFWVVLILFTIVKTKIVHYSSLAYFPLSFLASIYIYQLVNRKVTLSNYIFWFLMIIGAVFTMLLTALPFLAQHKNRIIPYIRDPFAVACLHTDVQWSGYEFLIGVFYGVVILILIVSLKQKPFLNYFMGLFFATAICLFFYLSAVVPKIEAYSQGPAINFYKNIAGKNVDAISVGYFSYAPYFYFEKPNASKYGTHEEDSLLNGKIDRPAYFVTKITNNDFQKSHPDCMLFMKEGGFMIFERLPLQ